MLGNFLKSLSNSLLSRNTLYFDGSHTNQYTKSGAGCVIIDNNGNLVKAAAYNLGDIDPQNVSIVEAIALRNGLKLAQSFSIKLDHVKGDNKEVIDHVCGLAPRRPKTVSLSEIITEIKVILNELNIDPVLNIELISRDQNGVADSLACEGSILLSARKVYNCEAELPARTAQLLGLQKSANGGGGHGVVGSRNVTQGPCTNYDSSSSSSSNTGLLKTVGLAGAAFAGLATIAFGVSKLIQEEPPENQHKGKSNANSTLSTWKTFTNSTNPNISKLIDSKFNVLNVDGLDSNQLEQAAAGCMIRDKDGELVLAAAYNLNYCYPNCHIGVAEAMALKNGLELAKDKNIELHLIEVDNEEVFNRVLGKDRRQPKERELIHVIEEIKKYLNELSIDPKTQLKLVSSVDNKVAHALANVGRCLNHGPKYYYRGSPDIIPVEVANLINKEKDNWLLS